MLREKREIDELKRRILQSRKGIQNDNNSPQMFDFVDNYSSTDQNSPKEFESKLLDKGSYNNPDNYLTKNNSIYDN